MERDSIADQEHQVVVALTKTKNFTSKTTMESIEKKRCKVAKVQENYIDKKEVQLRS